MKKNLSILLITLLFAIACGKKQQHLTVTTYAGTGLMGAANGPADEASFSNLMGLAIDAKGFIYVADSRNNIIRKIGPNGMVTTLAGSGAAGSADGKASAASFFFPAAVTADNSGNVYVADTHNSLIRKISADGLVSTIAGKWPAGVKPRNDGTAVLDNPMGIAADAAGNIFVADWIHDQIRKITPDGKISTVAGNGVPGAKDGPAASATFYLPEGLALDAAGNIYVSDTYNNMIRKISKDGIVTTLAGHLKKGKADGKGVAASFSHPDGIAIDKNGNIYVADTGNHLIRKISPAGLVATFAGCGARGAMNGDAKAASFYRPMGVAADTGGNVYVADYQNNLVRKISK
ncbi:MAG: NHL repeat-containing protein [Sphingobacteriales bacterium]